MYDAIKEGGSKRILGHLMRVPASSYFFALGRINTLDHEILIEPDSLFLDLDLNLDLFPFLLLYSLVYSSPLLIH